MQHTMQNGQTQWLGKEQSWSTIANFEARIAEEERYVNGDESYRIYVIVGVVNNQEQPPIRVPSDVFHTMNWPANAWGSQAIIYPQGDTKAQMRTAIALESKPIVTTIYTHTGWVTIDGKPHYLMNDCAIGAEGRRTDIKVQLPTDLKRYRFPTLPAHTHELCQRAVRASIALTDLPGQDVGWTIMGATWRAPISPVDFTVHLTGRTGTFKSELVALVQSHWGMCDARQLPASWSSTGNALESLAYHAKDALLVIDDFIPMGTSYQIKQYQKTADQIIRGQGNQAGRARLTDRSMLQETMYPRGLVLSTGEDTPEGHSVRARMMIAELTPGDIKPEALSTAQGYRDLYPIAMGCYIQWLARDLTLRRTQARNITQTVRDENLTVGHSRTPPTLGSILAGIAIWLEFAVETGAIPKDQAPELFDIAQDKVKRLAIQQAEYLTSANPADQFLSLLRGILAANAGHLKNKNGGTPQHATLLGWTSIGDPDMLEFKSHGPRLGWVDTKLRHVYLDAAVAYDTIRRHSRGAITLTRQTLYKRLREEGHLCKVDDARSRNTVRVSLEGASRQVLCIHLPLILEGE